MLEDHQAQAQRFLTAFNEVHADLQMFAIREGEPTESYAAPTVDAALAWGQALNESGWNIYFHVNAGSAGTRYSKDSIEVLRALHVDIDPPPGVGPAEGKAWREQVLITLDGLHPSFIVHSGRGLQGFWLLEQPVPLVEDATARKTLAGFENTNGRLAVHLNAGPETRDASRVMKVPGFIAHPSAAKRAAGWQPQVARLAGGDGCPKSNEALHNLMEQVPQWNAGDLSPNAKLVPAMEQLLPHPLDANGFVIPTVLALRQAVENMTDEQKATARRIWKKLHGGKNSHWVANGVQEQEKVALSRGQAKPPGKADPSSIWFWMMYAAAEETKDYDPVPAFAALMHTGFAQKSCCPTGYSSRRDKCEQIFANHWCKTIGTIKERKQQAADLARQVLAAMQKDQANVG